MPRYDRAALGSITMPAAAAQLRVGMSEGIDYQKLGSVLATELRRNPPVNKRSLFKAAQEQADYTERNSNY